MTRQERIRYLADISNACYPYKAILQWKFDGFDLELANRLNTTELWANWKQYTNPDYRYAYISYKKSKADQEVEFCSHVRHYRITDKMFAVSGLGGDLAWFSFTCGGTDEHKLYNLFNRRGGVVLMNTDFEVLKIESHDGTSFYMGNWRDGLSALNQHPIVREQGI